MSTKTPGGESDSADNSSSVNNISSLVAERGSGTATGMDEEFDESSIEALNWSEADEDEMQLHVQQRQKTKHKTTSPVVKKLGDDSSNGSIEGELAAASATLDQSTSSDATTVRVLSSSLLESINSGEDDGSVNLLNQTKKQVIENWATEVKEAVDRGEMEIGDDVGDDEDDGTVDDDEENKENITLRNRKGKKQKKKTNDEMTGSILSSLTSESGVGPGYDPLSNAPVLDEGPIWNKGPRNYRFQQENRRFNQKLTFGVLIAVVLAVGLGLGNLVAYNECETEYKQQQQQQPIKPIPSKIDPTTTPTPQTEEDLENLYQLKYHDLDAVIEQKQKFVNNDPEIKKEQQQIKPDIEIDREQYIQQIKTLSKIVQTLDNLQRKIDNFENHTRHLGGVIMMKDPAAEAETETNNKDSSMLVEETVHVQDEQQQHDEDYDEDSADEESFVLELIDGIEETVNYLRLQRDLKRLERLEKQGNGMTKSKLFSDTREISPEELDEIRTIEASGIILKKAHQEFIAREREELRERKILGLADDREPEDYSVEEKAEIKAKYDKFMEEYQFKNEIEVEKERLKFKNHQEEATTGTDITLEDDIDDFFKMYRSKENNNNNEQEDYEQDLLGFMSWFEEDVHKEDEEEEATVQDYIPETEFIVESSPEEKQPENGKHFENDLKKPKKLKRLPKSKSKKARESEQEDEFGNGKRHKKNKKHQQKENYEKRDKEKKKRSYGNHQGQESDQKPPKFKGYDLTNFQDDDGDDDDDHKRKKYHSSSSSSKEDVSNNGRSGSQDEDTNWLFERNKVREEIRKDLGSNNKINSQQNHHSSSGKKAQKNWQLERDFVRAKVRSKSKKNSFDV